MAKKYYVICDDDCRYESMTQEQILAAIEQALEQGFVSDPAGAVFSKIKEIRAGDAIQLWTGTESQFNELNAEFELSRAFVRVGANGVLYLCSDDTLAQDIENHINNENNPHNVTLEQIIGKNRLGIIHSTEEVATGDTWLDGKPVYAKTLVHTGAAGNTAYAIDLPADVNTVWLDMANSFHINTNGVSYPPYATVNNVDYFICLLGKTNVTYKTNIATGGDFYIRVLYTRTTD